jgi:hypothetical protein
LAEYILAKKRLIAIALILNCLSEILSAKETTMISKEDLNRLANLVNNGECAIQIDYKADGVREFSALTPEDEPTLICEITEIDLDTFINKCKVKRPVVIETEITDEMEQRLFRLAKQLNYKEGSYISMTMDADGLFFVDVPHDQLDNPEMTKFTCHEDFETFISEVISNHCLEEDDNDQ